MLAHKIIGATSSPNIISLARTHDASIDRALSSTPFSFSSVNLGAAASNRIIIVGVYAFRDLGPGAISGVTVNGVSATQVVTRNSSMTGALSLTMWAVNLTTGTSATVVVSHGSATTCGIGVYRMQSKSGVLTPSATFSTGYNATTGGTNNPSTISETINTSLSSAVVGFFGGINNTSPTWAGLTGDFSRDARSNEWFSGASKYPANVSGSLSVSATTTANTTSNIILACWS